MHGLYRLFARALFGGSTCLITSSVSLIAARSVDFFASAQKDVLRFENLG
jgi:hypothetical protein